MVWKYLKIVENPQLYDFPIFLVKKAINQTWIH